jgi:hypothetical protein
MITVMTSTIFKVAIFGRPHAIITIETVNVAGLSFFHLLYSALLLVA